MNELIFNGVNFTAFDAYYATSNFLDGAAKDYTSVSVLGRSGDLQISNNRYKNITVKVRVYVRSNMEQNIRAMRSYLESVNGYARLELSDQPNEYRIGLFKDMFAPKPYDRNVGVVDLTFDSMPQRFLKTGENWTTVTTSLRNPTLFPSKPIIRVWGNGSLQINSVTVTVANSPYEYVDIDCELMDCYYGSNNANSYVSFSTTDYVTLQSGVNSFVISGFTKVEVKPRWFEI